MSRLRVFLAFALLLGPLGRDLAFAATYYVNASQPNDTGDGLSPGAAKRNISAAILLANGNPDSSDTINVAAGTYSDSDCAGCGGTLTETFPLTPASGVSLVGAGADVTVIKGNQDAQPLVSYGNLDMGFNTTPLTLEGFTITNTGGYGVAFPASFGRTITANMRVLRNIITNNYRSGLTASLGANTAFTFVVSSNTITRNGATQAGMTSPEFGVTLETFAVGSTCSPSFTNNLIAENGASHSAQTVGGVRVATIAAGTAAPSFVGNTIRNNANYGVFVSPNAQPTFSRNTIKDNDDDDFNGTGYEGGLPDFYNNSGATLVAEHNWWKARPPNIDSGSPVHIDNDDNGAADVTDASPSAAEDFSFSILPPSGPVPGGTTINLIVSAGTFFIDHVGQEDRRIEVTVGGVPASAVIVAADGTALDAVVPAGAVGPADVTVTNPAGQSGTEAGGFTYVLPAALDVSGPGIYPNPWRPSSGVPLSIHSLPAGATVRVYTFNGELIREMTALPSGVAAWDVKNDAGEDVVSGVYFVFIEGDGVKKKMKVVVQR